MADADIAEGEVRGRGIGVEWEEKEMFNTGKRVTDFYSTKFFFLLRFIQKVAFLLLKFSLHSKSLFLHIFKCFTRWFSN